MFWSVSVRHPFGWDHEGRTGQRVKSGGVGSIIVISDYDPLLQQLPIMDLRPQSTMGNFIIHKIQNCKSK